MGLIVKKSMISPTERSEFIQQMGREWGQVWALNPETSDII
jgi:hypothetical protein